jgi:hypothetical protein
MLLLIMIYLLLFYTVLTYVHNLHKVTYLFYIIMVSQELKSGVKRKHVTLSVINSSK